MKKLLPFLLIALVLTSYSVVEGSTLFRSPVSPVPSKVVTVEPTATVGPTPTSNGVTVPFPTQLRPNIVPETTPIRKPVRRPVLPKGL